MLNMKEEDGEFLASLAGALVQHPRATLKELAQAIGVSKATLYRFCKTREELIQRLAEHGVGALNAAIEEADLRATAISKGLRNLLENLFEHRELTSFLMIYWKDLHVSQDVEDGWTVSLDEYFLRGQQQGIYRIDISAIELTEIFISLVLGMVDAEQRGRVARAGLVLLTEKAFLSGAGNHISDL